MRMEELLWKQQAAEAVHHLDIDMNATATNSLKTTPQMTRFRDAKVCNNWLQIRIDDHRQK